MQGSKIRRYNKLDVSLSADTIVAISTPPGQSGIGIVRLSGPQAISIAREVFFSPKGIDLFKLPSHILRYGFIRNEQGETIDEVLITIMHGPSTYTREDIVEINAHGGIIALREILELLLRKGARLAYPGEFTKRAFLNGRIDLAQAEAVADFIRAKTTSQARIYMRQIQGVLSKEIMKIKDGLLEVLAQLEALIDFLEEEIEVDPCEILLDKLKQIDSEIGTLISRAEMTRFMQNGVKVVITGHPNVGKSSLLNTLLSRERAIVTPIPGTTRDTLEEEIDIDGNLVRLIDTAGLCKTEDFLEREGIKRTEECLREADIVIFLLDAGAGITEQDREIISMLDGKKTIITVNKIDLPSRIDESELSRLFPCLPIVKISATQRINIGELTEVIKGLIWNGGVDVSEVITVSLRHEELLKNTRDSVQEAIRGIKEKRSEELVSIDLRDAISYIGQITGEVYTEDILEKIFSRFCIGK